MFLEHICRINYSQVYAPSTSHPNNCAPHFSLIKKPNFSYFYFVVLYWRMVDLPPPSVMGSGLTHTCAGLVHALTTTQNSYMHFPLCFWKILLPGSHVSFLTLLPILPFLLQCFLRLGREHEIKISHKGMNISVSYFLHVDHF